MIANKTILPQRLNDLEFNNYRSTNNIQQSAIPHSLLFKVPKTLQTVTFVYQQNPEKTQYDIQHEIRNTHITDFRMRWG